MKKNYNKSSVIDIFLGFFETMNIIQSMISRFQSTPIQAPLNGSVNKPLAEDYNDYLETTSNDNMSQCTPTQQKKLKKVVKDTKTSSPKKMPSSRSKVDIVEPIATGKSGIIDKRPTKRESTRLTIPATAKTSSPKKRKVQVVIGNTPKRFKPSELNSSPPPSSSDKSSSSSEIGYLQNSDVEPSDVACLGSSSSSSNSFNSENILPNLIVAESDTQQVQEVQEVEQVQQSVVQEVVEHARRNQQRQRVERVDPVEQPVQHVEQLLVQVDQEVQVNSDLELIDPPKPNQLHKGPLTNRQKMNAHGRKYKNINTVTHKNLPTRDPRGQSPKIPPVGLNEGEICLQKDPTDVHPVYTGKLTDDYEKYIEQGIRQFGSAWRVIYNNYTVFEPFTEAQVKTRARNIAKRRRRLGYSDEEMGVFKDIK